MPKATLATPKVTVRLFKSITRKVGDAGLSVSERYAQKSDAIDITPFLGDGSSITTDKDIGQPAGTFNLTFSDQPNATGVQLMNNPVTKQTLETIYGLVEPQDIIEIRMWGGQGTYSRKELPIVMRGVVTNITRKREMTQTGAPVRTVIISGQDYGKVLLTYQILYLPGYTGSSPLLTGYNAYELFGDQQRNTITAGDFLDVMLSKVINPLLGKLIPPNSKMPKVIVPDNQGVEGLLNNSYSNTEGSVMDLLNQHLDIGTFNEIFIEDREDGVYLVLRPRPYFDMATGKSTQPLLYDVRMGSVPDDHIVSMEQTRNDQEVYNFYWITAQRFDVCDDITRRLESYAANDKTVNMGDYSNSHADYYGIRALYVDTVLAPPDVMNMTSGQAQQEQDTRAGDIVKWVQNRRKIMVDNNKDNVVMETGMMSIKGGPVRAGSTELLRAGDYITVFDGQLEWTAYVTGVSHNFIPYQGYTTTLKFERGTGFNMRVSTEGGYSPWLSEQATRKSDNDLVTSLINELADPSRFKPSSAISKSLAGAKK
ncbi:hypothetical protein E0G74_00975 [Salmonella enterica]|nr:hypothetical protein [Salmonella enterica]